MKDYGPKDFQLSPEQIEEITAQRRDDAMQKQPAAKLLHSRKLKRDIEFYKFPKTVMDALVRANYMPALTVAMAVYRGWYLDFKKQNPVKLTSALLGEFQVSRHQKYKALKILDQSGQFLVENFSGRNPLVTMKWILIKD
jgi:hypothetical protein